jgi:hypothetical protein
MSTRDRSMVRVLRKESGSEFDSLSEEEVRERLVGFERDLG